MAHSTGRGLIGIVHAYPSKYLLDSLAGDGWRVVLIGPSAVIGKAAGHPAVAATLPVDLSDFASAVAELVRFASATPLQCLLPTYEGGVAISAKASEVLGLPSMSLATALVSRNKYLSYLLWSAQGVPVPSTVPLLDHDDAWRTVSGLFGGTAVIKLADSMNSQGVILVRDEASCRIAVETLRQMLGQDVRTPPIKDRNRFAYGGSDVKLIVQEYCEGAEVGVEVLLAGRDEAVLGIFEKAPSSGPCFAESMSVWPTSLGPYEERRVGETALRAARALGLSHGVAHVEIRHCNGEPRVLEAGLRPGGAYTAMAIERLIGINEYAAAARVVLGMPMPDLRAASQRAALYGGVVYPRSGRLRGVTGTEIFRDLEGLLDLQVLNQPGDAVYALPRSAQPHYCYYLLEGHDRSVLLERHAEIQRRVRLTVEEHDPGAQHES